MKDELRRVLGTRCWVLVKEKASTQYLKPRTLSAQRCGLLRFVAARVILHGLLPPFHPEFKDDAREDE